MVRFPLAAVLAFVALPPAAAQQVAEPASVQAIQKLLDEVMIPTAALSEFTALPKVLDILQGQIPKGAGVILKLDREAFGDDLAALEATTVRLPSSPTRVSLHTAFKFIRGRADLFIVGPLPEVRLAPGEIVLTTAPRAECEVVYDVRDLLARPDRLAQRTGEAGRARLRDADPAWRAGLLIRAIQAGAGEEVPRITKRERFEVVNGGRLLVRAIFRRQQEFGDVLQMLRRLGDLSVTLRARLYEVDEAFYKRLTGLKRVPLDELEQRLLAGEQNEDDQLWGLLKKQRVVLGGDPVTVEDNARAALLSRFRLVTCLPTPDQARNGIQKRQTILEGFSFMGDIHVSWDRRSVRLKLTEKVAEVEEIMKVGKDAEVPFVKETTQSRQLEIPDGGGVLAPVAFRPKEVRDKKRYWVLAIQARIIIEEEERHFRDANLEGLLPEIVKDVLTNPRLKALRELYGTPGDKRFALVNGGAWVWPEKVEINVKGHELAKAGRSGKRLLGIRVDRYDDDAGEVTVSLINAGGEDNGAAVGAGRIRYAVRSGENGWTVELRK